MTKTLEQEIEELKEELAERDETISELKKALKESDDEVDSLESAIEKKDEEIEELEDQIEEHDGLPIFNGSVILNLDTFHWGLEKGNLRVQSRIESFIEELKSAY
jgi:chromosome segregation ATPase